jgi:hypothetical protein
MVDKPNMDPKIGHTSSQPPAPPKGTEAKGSGWNPPPMTWLGMKFDEEQTKKLWNIITQNICNQINADKQKAIAAIRKMNPEHADDD